MEFVYPIKLRKGLNESFNPFRNYFGGEYGKADL
jgi:hypothetical protein